ncbi:MAG: chromate transporter [Spirochaetales bacterium]|nr:chromate transporter [Spirochaetales bacterium]
MTKTLFNLLWTFTKIGSVSFGGGYAMLPLLERELIDKRSWVTKEQILDYYAIGQSTPGIIAVNVSTFIGWQRAGWVGALAATLGFVLPSLVIITILAGVLTWSGDVPTVQHALAGVRVAVAALVLSTVIKFYTGAVKNKRGLGIFALTLGLSFFLGLSPFLLVLGGGFFGLILFSGPAGEEGKK